MRLPTLVTTFVLALPTMNAQTEAPKRSVAGSGDSASATAAATAARDLVGRVLPDHAAAFTCEVIPQEGGGDVFEVEARDGKIILRGNNGVSLAVAFNWYLRRECKLNHDWEAAGPLRIAGTLPLPAAKVRQRCAAPERFALNYCTYGYTFPWWDWTQWQRFIDWMAMNGINRPLLQCGQEATWLNVWKSYGLGEEEVRKFFVGPAHLPWQRMANLDSWGGPLPMSYIEGQRKLQTRILARARGLGMKPILAAFAGHVPKALKDARPAAKITRIEPGWGGTKPQYATWFLDPTDPLFTDIQHRFLGEQAAMYGTDHLYSADPFNEIPPPSWEPEYLALVSKTIYQSMAEADPDSSWYLMSWNFFFDQNWTPPRLKALTLAVPKGKMIYLDYVCEQAEFFRKTENFHGAPFVWCYVGNFGGTTNLTAPLNVLSARVTAALPVPNCRGIGTTLEGLNINPVAYDLLFELPWHQGAKVELPPWLDAYADRRAGRIDPAVRKAWTILREQIFTDEADGLWGRNNFLQTVPNLGAGAGKVTVPVRQAELVSVVDTLLQADPASRQADGYRYDLVNLTRQALGNATYVVGKRVLAAASRKDLPAFRREAARLLELGEDIDSLLGTRHEWLLGRWIADARAWAADPAEADYYEHNAREILTTWHEAGGGLSDYARREWNGLFRTYYMDRWREFIQRVDHSLESGTPFDAAAYQQWRVAADGNWVKATGGGFAVTPQGDPFETASRLMAKYRADLVVPAPETRARTEARLATAAWSPAAFSDAEAHRWTLDASPWLKTPGNYLVTFRYRKGSSALTIRKVAVVQDGRELAADTHDGWTGDQNQNNTYQLKARTLQPDKPVSLVMEVEPASGADSSGDIEIRREDPDTANP